MSAGMIDEPEISDVPLTALMQALGDETRLTIVRALAAEGELSCGQIELHVSKATKSHHFKVLRQAGLIATRVDGTHRFISLRSDELDGRFPGLLDAVLATPAAV
jgi:DNA-binding transcriptional ArsR family regulator